MPSKSLKWDYPLKISNKMFIAIVHSDQNAMSAKLINEMEKLIHVKENPSGTLLCQSDDFQYRSGF
jgi:hypothetical protein